MHGKVEKTYHALAHIHQPPEKDHWLVENRVERGEPRFRMRVVAGIANARSDIQLLRMNGNRGHFRLRPVTGKTHQLRLHMSSLGFGIVNDSYYPELLPQREDDFDRPLQLLARTIRFHDPVSGKAMVFQSERELLG
jgi:tRNA pseudouridine32 synthase/23S rRNA pseudouridine746 synthase